MQCFFAVPDDEFTVLCCRPATQVVGLACLFLGERWGESRRIEDNDGPGKGGIAVLHIRTRCRADMEEPRILGCRIAAVLVDACVVLFIATHEIYRVAARSGVFGNRDQERDANAVATVPPAGRDVLRNLRDALEARPRIARLGASGIVELGEFVARLHVVRTVDLRAVLVVNPVLGELPVRALGNSHSPALRNPHSRIAPVRHKVLSIRAVVDYGEAYLEGLPRLHLARSIGGNELVAGAYKTTDNGQQTTEKKIFGRLHISMVNGQ